ncbi:hypothetical protein QBC34DRAFT_107308 [Podospora aff. communis PSN243]|uniref:Adhesin domain-containing protein n=1 Tax=Podospora aff. communis PSN243 TaxID=3040156 RepID=A0AAV9H7N0_9PEZI|nr:hypothetical protein QBC34DRAFT_107308 [Podospora aff. communis PSN243]
MPYSDDLYSALDESDSGPIGYGLNQPEPQGSETHLQDSQGRQFQPDRRWDHGVSGGSGGDDDLDLDDNEELLSPTDGYFNATQSSTSTPYSPSSAASTAATSPNVPRVPNILVEDPSLPRGSTAESKAREADRERFVNREWPRQCQPRYPSGSNRASASRWNTGSRAGPGRDAHYTPASSSTYPYTPTSYTPYAPPRAAYDESSLLLPREAPPAYTPSPTSSSSSQSPASPTSYSTFPPNIAAAMGRHDETQGLLANAGEPQSMGNPDDDINRVPLTWRDRLRSRVRQPHNGRYAKVVLVALLLSIITIGFVRTAVSGVGAGHPSYHRNSTSDPSKDRLKQPQEKPFIPIVGRPPMDFDDGTDWEVDQICKDAQTPLGAKRFDVVFSADRKLAVSQDYLKTPKEYTPISVHGYVILRRAGSDTPGPSAVVEGFVNDDRIDIDVDWDADEQALAVKVPRGVPRNEDSTRPCLNLIITVWVPEDGALEGLYVGAIHLSVALMDNLSIFLSERAKLHSLVGSIMAAATGSSSRDESVMSVGAPDSFRFQSRIIEVSSTSGHVVGSWPLYDYLAIHTVSGNIKVGVEPKEAAKDKPKPAILYISSASGNVDFREPIQMASEAHRVTQALAAAGKGGDVDLRAETVLPPRDYRIDVHTASGFISGAAAFSTSGSFRTTSGDIKLDLLPVLDSSLYEDGGKQAKLETVSTSGTTRTTVLAPLWIETQAGRYIPLPPPLPVPPTPILPPRGDGDWFIPIGDDDPSSWIPRRVPHDRGDSDASTQAAPAADALQSNTADSRALRALTAIHSTTSGPIKVTYPAVWEGTIKAQTMSGDVSVRGEGVEIISGGGGGWPRRPLLAKKGHEKPGWINVESLSGGVDVLIGHT